MTSFKLYLTWILVIANIIVLNANGQIIKPCKVDDNACISESVKAAWSKITAGVPSAEVETSDPLFVKEIDGNLSDLKFKLTDSITTGYKNCDVNNVKLDINKLNLQLDLNCRNLHSEGLYSISGRLIIIPVEGKGTFDIFSKLYKMGVDAELKKIKGQDDKEYLQIKNFKLTLEAKEETAFNFTNLFNGQKDLANTVITFANQNWKEVANLVQDAVFNPEIKVIVKNVNKYLKTIPIDAMIIP